MTNFEYIKAKINEINDVKEFVDFISDYLNKHQWCFGSGDNYNSDVCSPTSCARIWLEKDHDVPPLKDGRIVEINNNLFVFTNKTFIGQNGGHKLDSKVLRDSVNKVYEANDFDDCNNYSLIWER